MVNTFEWFSKSLANAPVGVLLICLTIDFLLLLTSGLITYHLLKKWRLEIVGYLAIGFILGKSVLNLLSYPLVGMKEISSLAQNPQLEFFAKLNLSSYLISFALVVVLLKAGLGISVQVLKKTWRDSFLLSFVPNLCEALAVMMLSHFLIKLPWLESCMLGFIISAVSPAVVVPSMLRIEKEGYGTRNHVSQIVLTGASLDDIISISVFGATIGVWTKVHQLSGHATGGLASFLPTWLSGAEEVIRFGLGLLIGLLVGLILAKYFFKNVHQKFSVAFCLSLLLAMLFTLNFWAGVLLIAGTITAVATGFAIKNVSPSFAERSEKPLDRIWEIAKMLLFVLIAAKMDIHQADMRQIAWILPILLVGLLVRSLGVWLCLIKSPLNAKERLFCVFAYLPKATVQAALGAVPLSLVTNSGNSILIVYATTILSYAIFSILVTAPLGLVLVENTYRKLLEFG